VVAASSKTYPDGVVFTYDHGTPLRCSSLVRRASPQGSTIRVRRRRSPLLRKFTPTGKTRLTDHSSGAGQRQGTLRLKAGQIRRSLSGNTLTGKDDRKVVEQLGCATKVRSPEHCNYRSTLVHTDFLRIIGIVKNQCVCTLSACKLLELLNGSIARALIPELT
jgi:hypothetical protein